LSPRWRWSGWKYYHVEAAIGSSRGKAFQPTASARCGAPSSAGRHPPEGEEGFGKTGVLKEKNLWQSTSSVDTEERSFAT
jgi:hypothetical protein